MMETIKQVLFTNWNLMRWIRLLAGVFITVQAIQMHNILYGLIAAFVLFQALSNTGCCGTNGCALPVQKNKTRDAMEDVKQNP